jgi:hypothetical protein
VKVFPVVIADETYFDLFELFEKSIRKTGYPFEPTRFYVKPNTVFVGNQAGFLKKHGVIQRSRPLGYGQWGNWVCCESYMAVLKDLAADPLIGDDDYVMDADADIVMMNTKILDRAMGAEMAAFKCCDVPMDFPKFGKKNWVSYSGCFVMMKGSVIRKMAALSTAQILEVKDFMALHNWPFNDDTFMSFLTLPIKVEVRAMDGDELFVHKPEDLILGKVKSEGSIVHWFGDTGTWKTFLGRPVTGKRDLPRAIRESGIDWP